MMERDEPRGDVERRHVPVGDEHAAERGPLAVPVEADVDGVVILPERQVDQHEIVARLPRVVDVDVVARELVAQRPGETGEGELFPEEPVRQPDVQGDAVGGVAGRRARGPRIAGEQEHREARGENGPGYGAHRRPS